MKGIDINNIFNRNTLVVGPRNAGKTTILKQVVRMAVSQGYRIILLDSATEHTDKSILVYCKSIFDDYVEILSPDKDSIVGKSNYRFEYPYDIINTNISHSLFLFDVSKYLEDGFLEEEIELSNNCWIIYKRFITQCLEVMFNFVRDDKWIVIMDEIEFSSSSFVTISKYNSKGVFVFDCLHTTDSCDNQICNIFDIHQLHSTYPNMLGQTIDKPRGMLCGSACLYYWLNIVNHLDIDVPNGLFWTTDIASFLQYIGIEHSVSCYNSSLYNDFINGVLDSQHPGYKSLKNYLDLGKTIALKELSVEDMTNNLSPNYYFIAGVKSSLLFGDDTIKGYHYILVRHSMDKFEIINPMKIYYKIQCMDLLSFVSLVNVSGNWIIKLSGLKNA